MFNLKQASLFAVTIAAISVSAVCSTDAQAAIVGGQIQGNWQSAAGGVDGLSVDTAFTADYTYDNSIASTIDASNGIYTQFDVKSFPLLSLIVNSGAFSQTFNTGTFELLNIKGGPISNDYISTGFQFLASDSSQTIRFLAQQSAGQLNSNTPFSSSSAKFDIDNNNNPFDGSPIFASTNKFTNGLNPPATPVPTPALLPGLVGLGMATLRKRKNQGQEAAER